jgi:hypothetical protein
MSLRAHRLARRGRPAIKLPRQRQRRSGQRRTRQIVRQPSQIPRGRLLNRTHSSPPSRSKTPRRPQRGRLPRTSRTIAPRMLRPHPARPIEIIMAEIPRLARRDHLTTPRARHPAARDPRRPRLTTRLMSRAIPARRRLPLRPAARPRPPITPHRQSPRRTPRAKMMALAHRRRATPLAQPHRPRTLQRNPRRPRQDHHTRALPATRAQPTRTRPISIKRRRLQHPPTHATTPHRHRPILHRGEKS